MTTGTRLDHLTRFDLSAAADDVTAILSADRPREKGLADSLYRDALTRSLQRSARLKPQNDDRRPETTQTPRRIPDFAQKPSQTETKAGTKPPADEPKSDGKSKRPPETQKQQTPPERPAPRSAKQPPKADTSAQKTAPTPDQQENAPEDPSVRINAAPGTPPAQFQPIAVTSGAAEDGQVQLDGSQPGGSHPDDPVGAAENASTDSEGHGRGPQHARTVIESLLARFDAAADQPKGQNQGPPSPPAGLFQALAALSARIEGESQHSDSQQTQLVSDIPLQAADPTPDGTAVDEAVGFDSTPSDSDTRLGSVVTTEDVSTENLQAGLDSDLIDEATPADSEENENANQQNNAAEGEAKNFSGPAAPEVHGEALQTPSAVAGSGDPTDMDGAAPNSASPRQSASSVEKSLSGSNAEPATTTARTISSVSPPIDVADAAVRTAPPTGAAPTVSTTPAQQHSTGDSSTVPLEDSSRGATTSATARQTGTRSAENPLRLVDRIAEAVRQAGRGGQQLKIRLNPPELGALQIEVASRNGGLTARLEVQTPAAQQQIMENLHLLRETLAQNGTPVERIEVQLNESWRDQPSSGFGGRQQPDEDHSSQQNPQQQPGDPDPEIPIETDDDDSFNPSAPTEQLDIHV